MTHSLMALSVQNSNSPQTIGIEFVWVNFNRISLRQMTKHRNKPIGIHQKEMSSKMLNKGCNAGILGVNWTKEDVSMLDMCARKSLVCQDACVSGSFGLPLCSLQKPSSFCSMDDDNDSSTRVRRMLGGLDPFYIQDRWLMSSYRCVRRSSSIVSVAFYFSDLFWGLVYNESASGQLAC